MAVMIYWFTKHIDKKDIQNQLNLDKKDTQNQANLDRFIVISEKYSNLTERIAASLDRHIEKIDGHGLKLDQIYEDLKEIKNTHKFLR